MAKKAKKAPPGGTKDAPPDPINLMPVEVTLPTPEIPDAPPPGDHDTNADPLPETAPPVRLPPKDAIKRPGKRDDRIRRCPTCGWATRYPRQAATLSDGRPGCPLCHVALKTDPE